MNAKHIKEIIKVARESVIDIEDIKLKEKTYEIILNNLMSGKKHLENEKESQKNTILESPKEYKEENSDTIAILSKKFNVSPEKIEDYFEFNKKDFEILCPIFGRSNAEEHLIFTLLILTLKKIGLDEREIDSAQLRDLAKSKGIKSLVNLSTNLKKYSDLVIHKSGKRGSTNTSYKLTIDGYNKGVQIIEKILAGKPLHEGKASPTTKNKQNNSGLGKEIDKLYDEGFFDMYRTINETRMELRKRTFFNRRQDIDAYIRQTLTKSKGLLLREKKGKIWSYVKRK